MIVDYTVGSRIGRPRRRLRVAGGTMVADTADLAAALRAAGVVERRRVARLPRLSDCVYLVLDGGAP